MGVGTCFGMKINFWVFWEKPLVQIWQLLKWNQIEIFWVFWAKSLEWILVKMFGSSLEQTACGASESAPTEFELLVWILTFLSQILSPFPQNWCQKTCLRHFFTLLYIYIHIFSFFSLQTHQNPNSSLRFSKNLQEIERAFYNKLKRATRAKSTPITSSFHQR